jgi:hypothetical protein
MLDSLDVSSFNNPSFLDVVCPSPLRIVIHLLVLLTSRAMIFYDMSFLLACVDLFFDRLWTNSTDFKDSSCYDTLKMQSLDYIFLVVLPFFKCSGIAYALH